MEIFKNTHEWLAEAKPTKPKFSDIRKWINEELDEFEEAVLNNNINEMYDAVIDANIFLANISYAYSLSPNILSRYANAIHESNLTKFCKSEAEAIETVQAYKSGTHPNKPGTKLEAAFRVGNDNWIVYNVADNKILKSINFEDTQKFI